MANERYKITFELAGGAVLTIDSPARIDTFRCEVASGDGVKDDGFAAMAREVLSVYRRRRTIESKAKLPQATTFSKHGVELEVIGCYMAGLTINQTRQFLKNKTGVIAARSSVGRMFRDLFAMKAARSLTPIEVEL